MTEIENVAGTSAGIAQNLFRPRSQVLPFRKEQNRIKVPLHRALVTDTLPAGIERDSPVDTDHIRARLLHRWQECSAVGAEVNNRYPGFVQSIHKIFDMGQRIAPVILHAQASHPTIENLDRVRAGTHLFGGVRSSHGDEFAH